MDASFDPIPTAPDPPDAPLARVRAALGDRYLVEKEIGRGGMAAVYLAHDARHDRPVAVKVLHPALGEGRCEPDRFLREIRFAARLVHPGIVPLHDSGERGGLLYFVMPFLDAETLRGCLVRRGRLGIEESVAIARGLATALDYAHRQNVIHRDIKPENILLHEGGPMLADFGVARAISAAERADGAITERGMAVGTPAYMSPEQAAGDNVLDGRSDQYSLACVVYEMLAGTPPFPDDGARATMARHVSEPPRPLRALRPEVPVAADTALRRALAKDPADRFATVLEFVDAMSTPDGGMATLAGAAMAIAVLPFVNLSGDPDAEYLSDGIADELINVLTLVDGLRVASRTSAFAFKGGSEDVRAIGAKLDVGALVEGSVRQSGRRLRISVRLTSVADGRTLWSQRFDRELADVFAIEDEIARTIASTLRATLLRPVGDPTPKRYTANLTAHRLYLQGRFAWDRRTAEAVAEAIRLFEAAIVEDPEYALAYTGLSDAYALHVDYSGLPVIEGYRRAREMAEKALALDEGLAEAHASLAWVRFIHDWDWAGAFHQFRRSIELNPAYATAHQWYAFPLIALGRIAEGVAEARLARELDPASVAIRRTLGFAYYYARRYDEAAEYLRRAVALNPTAEETHRVLGRVYLASGELDRAEAAFREALAAQPDSTSATGLLGATLARLGREREARAALEALEARAARGYVSPVPFGYLAVALGEKTAALDAIDRAIAERRGWPVYLNVDPLLDPLRGEPRFRELLRRMRLAG
jgi:serine/threonine-protein kinase